MTTFNDGESGLSVRTKINEAIDKVDGNTAFDNDIDVNGNISLGDNDELRFGDSNDLIIEHTGALTDIRSATGHMSIRNFADDHDVSIQSDDGSGGTTNYFVADGSTGEAKMYYYGAQRLATKSTGVTISGNLILDDNEELRFGDVFVLEHNGTDSDIRTASGDLLIRNLADDQDVRILSDDGAGGTADYFRADGSTGEAQLFYYGSEKLNTKSTGVDVTGDLTVDFTTLHVDSTNNRVGIGLINPGSELHIFGSTPQVRLQVTGDTQNNRIEFCNSAGVIQSTIKGGGVNGDLIQLDGDVDVSGALSKGSGSFKIDHPLKPETHHLVHSFVEAPQADNIYRGKVSLVDGSATVNLDEAGRMTAGTFVALNTNIQCFTTNEDGWTAVRGSVLGNTLTIEAQDISCTDTVSWLVIGERHDQHMLDTGWTDAAGRVITEPEKQAEEDE